MVEIVFRHVHTEKFEENIEEEEEEEHEEREEGGGLLKRKKKKNGRGQSTP